MDQLHPGSISEMECKDNCVPDPSTDFRRGAMPRGALIDAGWGVYEAKRGFNNGSLLDHARRQIGQVLG